MPINVIRDFTFENYKRIGFSKENRYYSIKHYKNKDLQMFSTKLTKKILDPCNAKKHYQSFIRKKITKSVKKKLLSNQKLLKTQTLLI